MKRFQLYLLRHRHLWPFLYALIYMPWFISLENKYENLSNVAIIHSALDDMIPFCELFIVPYILWFLYIPLVFIFMYFSSNKEFYRICAYEFVGMTIALIIFTVYPNGHDLRVDLSVRDNIFMTLLSYIYSNDTSTNVLPSIHVYATVAAHVCLVKSPQITKRPYIKYISGILSILICASTVMLKQHSIIDSICGFILAYVMYLVVFKWWFKNITISAHNNDKLQALWWINKKSTVTSKN